MSYLLNILIFFLAYKRGACATKRAHAFGWLIAYFLWNLVLLLLLHLQLILLLMRGGSFAISLIVFHSEFELNK